MDQRLGVTGTPASVSTATTTPPTIPSLQAIATTTPPSPPIPTKLVEYGRPYSGVFIPRPKTTTAATTGTRDGSGESASPFVGLRVDVRVTGVTADVTMVHTFVNREDCPIEAVFKFAPGECSVYELEVRVADRVIKGVIQEKQSAANKYDDAIASGHGAYLLEKEVDPLQGAVLRMQIGNLPPHSSAVVTLKYISELYYDQGHLRFELPNTHCLPISGEGDTKESGFLFSGDIEAPAVIASIEHSHPISSSTEGVMSSIKATLSTITEVFWFELILVPNVNPDSVYITIEQDEDLSKVAMISLFPSIKTEQDTACELIFLVDRSGSMSGTRINQVKNAMQLFLRSIPNTCTFNIVGFGSRFEKLFGESIPYDEQSFTIAKAHITALRADLGGTDVLPPLQDILLHNPQPNVPRQIFFLTDGDVSDTNAIISFVKCHSGGTRIFTFGIAAEASPQLVTGLAVATRGKAEFISSGTRLESKVMSQIKRALQPVLRNVEINWGTISAKQSPALVPPLFDGDRLLVYGFLGNTDNISESTGRVRGFMNEQEISFPFQLSLSKIQLGKSIHRLAFHSLIKDLEESPENKQQIVDLALKYQLLSKYTTFICVETRSEAVNEPMQLRTVEYASKAEKHTSPTSLSSVLSPSSGSISKAAVPSAPPSPLNVRPTTSARTGQRRENARTEREERELERERIEEEKRRRMEEERRMEREKLVEKLRQEERTRMQCEERQQEKQIERQRLEESRQRAMGELQRLRMESVVCLRKQRREETLSKRRCVGEIRRQEEEAELPMARTKGAKDARREQEQSAQTTTSSRRTDVTKGIDQDIPSGAQVRPLDKLIFLQSSDGSWPESLAGIASVIGCTSERILQSMPAEIRGLENCQSLWNTAIALASLHMKFCEYQDEWEMLALKSRRWLTLQLKAHNSSLTATDLVVSANSVLLSSSS
ncbi:von Willebrand factor type A domain [Pelomyxa schiedti]|nr:von Willebrand factor type A domain [Pelomyxa schiedti]